MTGYARVRRDAPGGELLLTIKSVNHRGLDLRFHASAELEGLENQLRPRIAQQVARGHLDVRLAYNRAAGPEAVTLNRPLLAAYLAAFRQAAAEHGLPAEPDLSMAFRTPGILTDPSSGDLPEGLEQEVQAALAEALEELNGFREREGAALAAEVYGLAENIRRAAARMEAVRGRALPGFQERLRARLAELLDGIQLDPQRLAQEAAVLADRSDIGEEIARLKIHAGQLLAMLRAGGEVGKRMDFLLQEMQRETNTILSKTNGIGEAGLEITDLGLATKSDIEKIREQALNLE